jgi:hypothetical protein
MVDTIKRHSDVILTVIACVLLLFAALTVKPMAATRSSADSLRGIAGTASVTR